MPAVRHQLRRFLFNADKPALLAIARPATKKNLAAFVCAYGMSPELQEAANLLILAGHRQSMDELEPECAAHIREILSRIDEYELYGKVAFPKSHRTENVPAYCAYARETGGVFVSPALKEPFGLTLLEASAAGLRLLRPIPEVRTISPSAVRTGSSSIREAMKRPPTRAGSCSGMIGSGANAPRMARARWKCSTGRRTAANTSNSPGASPSGARGNGWRHAQGQCSCPISTIRCLDRQRGLPISGSGMARRPTCCSASLRAAALTAPFPFSRRRKRRSAVSGIRDFRGRLGNSYRDANEATFSFDRHWADHISAGWNRAEIERVIEEGTSLLEQRAFKLSYFVKGGPDAASRLRWLLSKKGLNATR